MHTSGDSITGGQKLNEPAVMVISTITRMMLKSKVIRGMGISRKRSNYILNKIMHTPIGRTHLDL